MRRQNIPSDPYAAPVETDPDAALVEAAVAETRRRSPLPWILLSAIAGGLLGANLLSPYLRTVRNTSGDAIGFGLGGFGGLAVYALTLAAVRFRRNKQAHVSDADRDSQFGAFNR